MKNFKKTRTALIISALCAAAMLTACGNSAGSPKNTGNSESSSEWWDTSKEGMEEEETTAAESDTKPAETTESTTEDSSEQETSSATDSDSSQDSSQGGDKNSNKSGNGQNGSGNKNDNKDKSDTASEEVENDIIINGERNHHWGGLRWVKVNGYEFDSIYITKHLDLFMDCAQVQKTDKIHYNPSDDNDDVFFYGNGYSAEGIDGCLYVEVVPVIMGSLPSTDEVDLSKPEGYYLIRSLYANEDTPEELGVTFAGIKIGDSKEEIEKLYGAGGNTNGYTYYADKEGALLLTYDEDDKVKEMYLFIDYEDYLKIKYTME